MTPAIEEMVAEVAGDLGVPLDRLRGALREVCGEDVTDGDVHALDSLLRVHPACGETEEGLVAAFGPLLRSPDVWAISGRVTREQAAELAASAQACSDLLLFAADVEVALIEEPEAVAVCVDRGRIVGVEYVAS